VKLPRAQPWTQSPASVRSLRGPLDRMRGSRTTTSAVTETIAVAGSLAQRPNHGGHTWVLLQYLLGFRRLGWDVLFVDRLEPDMCVDAMGDAAPLRHSHNLRYLMRVMDGFGLGDDWVLLFDRAREVVGVDRQEATSRLRRSAFLLNVMGFLDHPELLAAARRRVFLDIDPGFGQMWREVGLQHPLGDHDDYVTIAENIGRPDCAVPTGGISWITTKQPVVLDEWTLVQRRAERFTSVGAWRGPFEPVEYAGRTYGLRVHEFRRFLELPRRTGVTFELALDIDEAEVDDLRRLREAGWMLVDPRTVAADPWRYRDYVRSSMAELMVAKNMYVQSRSGWFSDRSICYLASGRPVLAQDTGLDSLVPTGEGLISFVTPDEAVAGVDAITGNYNRHACAARAIAEEHFASDRVLTRLLDRLGVEGPRAQTLG
jgi:hypothetical protein